jgi:hypothetical protein
VRTLTFGGCLLTSGAERSVGPRLAELSRELRRTIPAVSDDRGDDRVVSRAVAGCAIESLMIAWRPVGAVGEWLGAGAGPFAVPLGQSPKAKLVAMMTEVRT